MRLYFDTSIWLDIFEDRDEPMMPKSSYAKELLELCVKQQCTISISRVVFDEMQTLGYSVFDLDELFKPLRCLLVFLEPTERQFGKAKDLSAKRNIPLRDAMHALIARDQRATLVTRDRHFQVLRDIVPSVRPEDII